MKARLIITVIYITYLAVVKLTPNKKIRDSNEPMEAELLHWHGMSQMYSFQKTFTSGHDVNLNLMPLIFLLRSSRGDIFRRSAKEHTIAT